MGNAFAWRTPDRSQWPAPPFHMTVGSGNDTEILLCIGRTRTPDSRRERFVLAMWLRTRRLLRLR